MVEAIRAGHFPFMNTYASCGQPLAGNPNHAVFFPDTILFAVLPLRVAFGLHFALAAILAWAGARRLARVEGASRETAEVVGLAFVASGVFVSAWTFYNVGMALAVAPWVVAATVRLANGRGRMLRAVAALGVTGALEVLAGEPVLALLVALVCAVRLLASRTFRRIPLAGALGAGMLATLLAAPLLFCTWQAARGSSRDLARYAFEGATSTSVHPARLLEQAAPFPFGRPDVVGGEQGFAGRRFFQGTAPYLWTLQLGWVPVLLLVAFGGARSAGERAGWILAGGAAILSLGSWLPGARLLFPVLSLGGRIRYPVKWWYVVLLALVPLLAAAIERWHAGAMPGRVRRIGLLGLLGTLAVTGGVLAVGDFPQIAAVVTSLLAAIALVLSLRWGSARRPGLLLALFGIPALVAMAPLLFTAIDRPASSIEPLPAGRLFERVTAEPHAPSESSEPTREVFRRAQRQGWALTGALSGIPYAFDGDPDGSYSFYDRIVREAADSAPWPARAAELRLAGVAYVIAREELGDPYRLREVLDSERGVRLYDLEGAAPSVRRVGRIFRAPHFNATVAIHRSPVFNASTDVVLPGKESVVEGEREAGTVKIELETPDRLVAQVDGASPGVVVWSRTYFPAWRAEVNGAKARVLAADGHLVGVLVPAGAHRLEVVWPRQPLLLGTALCAIGAILALWLRKRR
jgi:hypothetical protein